MAKIGNQQLIDPALVDEIYNFGTELGLSPCGLRIRGGEETNMICFRNSERDVQTVENEGLVLVESYPRFAAYTYTALSERSLGERSIGEKSKDKGKGKEVQI
jgi:hypothetical protein